MAARLSLVFLLLGVALVYGQERRSEVEKLMSRRRMLIDPRRRGGGEDVAGERNIQQNSVHRESNLALLRETVKKPADTEEEVVFAAEKQEEEVEKVTETTNSKKEVIVADIVDLRVVGAAKLKKEALKKKNEGDINVKEYEGEKKEIEEEGEQNMDEIEKIEDEEVNEKDEEDKENKSKMKEIPRPTTESILLSPSTSSTTLQEDEKKEEKVMLTGRRRVRVKKRKKVKNEDDVEKEMEKIVPTRLDSPRNLFNGRRVKVAKRKRQPGGEGDETNGPANMQRAVLRLPQGTVLIPIQRLPPRPLQRLPQTQRLPQRPVRRRLRRPVVNSFDLLSSGDFTSFDAQFGRAAVPSSAVNPTKPLLSRQRLQPPLSWPLQPPTGRRPIMKVRRLRQGQGGAGSLS